MNTRTNLGSVSWARLGLPLNSDQTKTSVQMDLRNLPARFFRIMLTSAPGVVGDVAF